MYTIDSCLWIEVFWANLRNIQSLMIVLGWLYRLFIACLIIHW